MKKFAQVEEPVVIDRPGHNREVESIDMPGGSYYRAFDGEKMVLVPKENLEAMKGIVNIKMRRRAESKATHYPDPAAEKKELNRFERKLEHLHHQIEEYEEKTLEPLMEELKLRNEIVEDVGAKFRKSEVAPTMRQSVPSLKSLPSPTSPQSTSEEISLPRGSLPDRRSIKFLVSGHFRNSKKPIFIVRQYRGSSVIGDRQSDFNSSRTEKGVDVLISGKFYKQSILQEVDEKPKNIKFKARKKILIDGTSNVLEEGFVDLFSISEIDVVVGGMFVKSSASPHYTPLVSIAIKRRRRSNSQDLGEGLASSEKKDMVVSVSTPVVTRSPFVEDLRKTRSVPKGGYRRRQTASSIAHHSRGFKSLLTRIDEGEEAFECPPSPKPNSRSSSISSTSTQNSLIKRIEEPRASFTFSKMFGLDSFKIFKRKEHDIEDEPKYRRVLSTMSMPTASRNPMSSRVTSDRAKYVDTFPSTSKGEALTRRDDGTIVTSVLGGLLKADKNGNKRKSSKKPGFFRRIFKRLFSRK